MRSLIKNPLVRAVLAAVSLGALFFTAGASASTITIYKNGLDTPEARAQIRQMAPNANCDRGGSTKAFRFELGKRARECFYRVPAVGQNLQVTATARIFKSTPKRVLKRAYAGVSLRQSTDGSRYQFVVWPSTRRYGLRKVQPNGRIINFGSRKAGNKVKGPDKANRLTLRAFTGPHGGAQLVGYVNGHKVVAARDEAGNSLIGRDTSFSIGAKNTARGAIGSFIDVRVAMPDPY
ncbi:MAG: hypothetical protein IT199_03255 [Solirubrobacterales bacterium]|nr:hypothetical protein [Solirubrobacterales bacterium]